MNRHESDNLDRLLSNRLKKALDDDGRAGWLDVRERAGMSRTVWHWSRARVVLVAVALLLGVGACAGSTGVIPWFNQKPSIEVPRLAPPCKAKNLSVSQDFGYFQPPGQSYAYLTNTGSRACSLAGRFRVALVDPEASEPRLFLKHASRVIDPLEPNSLLRSVPPRQEVVLEFFPGSWCERGSLPKWAFQFVGPLVGSERAGTVTVSPG
jgi:hypothetical protein